MHTHPRERDRALWAPILRGLLEAAPMAETWYAPHNTAAHDAGRCAPAVQHTGIDMWYVGIHPLLATQYQINAAAYVYTAHRARPSDHMPVALFLRPRDTNANGRMPIPHWLARHPRFATLVMEEPRTISFVRLHPNDAVRRMKQTLQNAARARPCAP